jgi:hypothetical protein
VSVDFDFGVGEGFGATVRVRVDGVVDEFVFCAQARLAQATTTETITRKIFTIVSSLNVAKRRRVKIISDLRFFGRDTNQKSQI